MIGVVVRRHAIAPLISGALLAGCALSTSPQPAADAPTFADAPLSWPHVPGAGGFDPLDVDAIWSAGDFVRYWIEADADGTRHTWTLELGLPAVPGPTSEVVFGDLASGFVRMRNAISQTSTDRVTRTKCTRYCHYPVDLRARLRRERTGEVFATDIPTQVQAHVWHERVDAEPEFGIDFLFRALVKVDRLLDELLLVVKPPSTWSVVRNGMRAYVALKLHPPKDLAVFEVDTPLGRLPAFWLPATLWANDQKALDCRFLITWRRSPLLLSMGVLRIEGCHPEDSTKRVSLHLIAARRGQAVQVQDRDDLGPPGVRKGMSEQAFRVAVRGEPGDRYRVVSSTGAVVDLVAVACDKPLGDIVGAFEGGRLLYCNFGGLVALFLQGRGFAAGPYRKENRIAPGAVGK